MDTHYYTMMGIIILVLMVGAYMAVMGTLNWDQYKTICTDKGYDGVTYKWDGYNCYKRLEETVKLFPIEEIMEANE